MVEATVIRNFTKGKTTRHGKPLPPDEMPPEQTVTAVRCSDALEAFGCRNRNELQRYLRDLRDQGRLVHERNKLTQRVRTGEVDARGRARKVRCYVIRNEGVPQLRTSRRYVTNW